MSTITLFNKAFPGNDVAFSVINKLAVKVGYLVHPDCCTKDVLHWLTTQSINYNATFYKSWNDIISKNRFELFIDQIRHYVSTYGTDFQETPFIPNDGAESPIYKDLKVILPITKKEANERACKMLYSGMALKTETLEMLLPLATEVNIDLVKNKEALMYICKEKGLVPTDNIEFIRFLVFLATAKTLLIKSKAVIAQIKSSSVDISTWVDKFGIEKLSV